MKRFQLQNILNCFGMWLLVVMLVPCVLEAKKGRRAHGQPEKVQVVDEKEKTMRQDLTTRLQKQFGKFKKTLKWFRDCLVDGTCTPEEREDVVSMANNILRLSLLAVGMSIVETGEYVTKKVESLKGIINR